MLHQKHWMSFLLENINLDVDLHLPTKAHALRTWSLAGDVIGRAVETSGGRAKLEEGGQ